MTIVPPVPCWSCHAPYDAVLALAACAACGVVLPVHPLATPYALLGIEGAPFDIDTDGLERAWLAKSRRVHPDRFARKSDTERRYAVEQTAALNAAYNTLRDPLARAQWLLRSAGASDSVPASQAFLVDMLEQREEADVSDGARARVLATARRRFDETLVHVRDGFATRAALTDTGRRVAELRYLARLVDELGGARVTTTLARD